MAFVLSRKHKNGRTWYVRYYYNGRLVRKKVGSSKILAKKVQGDIEAKMERADVGLLKKDYPIDKFFGEFLAKTKGIQVVTYHDRKRRVIKNFKRFLKAERPYLTKLSLFSPEVIEAYQRFRMKEVTPHSKKPIKKRTVNIEVSSPKTFLNKAVKWDMLSYNTLEGVEYLKEYDSKMIRALTDEEVCKLLKEANGWFRPFLLVLPA